MMRSAKKETKLMTFNDYVDSLDDLDNNMDVGQFYELLTGQSYNTSLGDNIQDEKLKKLEDARYYYAEISSESWAQSEDFEESNEAFINALKEYATDCGVADMKFLVVDGKPCIPDNIRKDMPGACKSDEAIYFAPNLVDAEPAQTESAPEVVTGTNFVNSEEAKNTIKLSDWIYQSETDVHSPQKIDEAFEMLLGSDCETPLNYTYPETRLWNSNVLEDLDLKALEYARDSYVRTYNDGDMTSNDFEEADESLRDAMLRFAEAKGISDIVLTCDETGTPTIPNSVKCAVLPGANMVTIGTPPEPTEEKDTVSITDAFHEAIETCKDGDYGAALLQFGSAIVDKVKDVAGAAKDKVAGLIDPDFQDLIDEESKSGEQASVDDLQA